MRQALKNIALFLLYLSLSLAAYVAFNRVLSPLAIKTVTPQYEERVEAREQGAGFCDKGGQRLPDFGFPLTTADVQDCNKEGKFPTLLQFGINTVLYLAVIQVPVTVLVRKKLRRRPKT